MLLDITPSEMELLKSELNKNFDLGTSIKSSSELITPNFYRLVLSNIVGKFNKLPDEYKTDWLKLWKNPRQNNMILRNIFSGLFGVYNGDIFEMNNLEVINAKRNVSFIATSCDSKESLSESARVLSEVLINTHIVQELSSNETSNREAEELAKKIIARAKREGKKVVFITMGMAIRSFSIPEIDTIFLLFDGKSNSVVEQIISRGYTIGFDFYGVKKTNADIISLSLDPNREYINPIDEWFFYHSNNKNNRGLSLQESVKHIFKSVNLFTNNEYGQSIPVVAEDYSTTLGEKIYNFKLDYEETKVNKIIDYINDLKFEIIKHGKNEITKIESIDRSQVKRNDSIINKKNDTTSVKVEDNVTKLRKLLITVCEKVYDITSLNNFESDNILETLDMIKEKGLEDELIIEVGTDVNTIKFLFERGALNEFNFNTFLIEYNKKDLESFWDSSILVQ